MTEIPNDKPRAICGQQLTLIPQPARNPLPRAEWRTLEALGVERRHQKYSRSSRAEAKAFYRQVFVKRDAGDTPPIAQVIDNKKTAACNSCSAAAGHYAKPS